jgi:hypothetical protein
MRAFSEELDRDQAYELIKLCKDALERGLEPHGYGLFVTLLQLSAACRRMAVRCDELAREYPLKADFDAEVLRLHRNGALDNYHIPYPLPLVTVSERVRVTVEVLDEIREP